MDEPAYYAVIPPVVRYANISAGAKLLYGEIAALSSRDGVCYATNSYFAKLYGVESRTASRLISELEAAGFLRADTDKKRGNIRKLEILVDKNISTTIDKKDSQHSVSDNTNTDTDNNNILSVSDTGTGDGEFNLKKEIHKLKTSPRRHLSLIGEYLEERKVDLQNREQFQYAIRRHVKAARELSNFTDEQIGNATVQAQKEYPNYYTLETLLKILTR